MDTNLKDKESLVARIQQLEHERDELHKDIEQLCMQQAGPSYLAAATRMHFQRTAGLEHEIENLKKKLAVCTRDNLNLQEELSEAYRIKAQLAELHQAEVAKNIESEKQVKFFQGCVAAAFAERDNSIIEAEKAKEKEEVMSQKFNEIQQRLEVLTSDCLEYKRLNDALQSDLSKQEEQIETFKKVVDKFYEIKQHSFEGFEDTSWDEKCACLLHDSEEMWSYNDASTFKYISALEKELETLRNSLDNLQSKLHVGLEIENHLKKKVRELEKKQILWDKMIMNRVAELRHHHSQHRAQIMNLLGEERSHINSIINMVEEKSTQTPEPNLEPSQRVGNLEENEFQDLHIRDVHISTDANHASTSKSNDQDSPNTLADREGLISEALAHVFQGKISPDSVADREGNMSEPLAQALQEKVAALLLLSQQEERHLLERNVSVALQKKIEELQRNLLQVTNEKVKALMELAQSKLEYQQLREEVGREIKQGNLLADAREKRLSHHERDGTLRNLLKRSYLKRWVGTLDFRGNEAEARLNSWGNFSERRSKDMDFARMKIENASLKESMESMDHLISSVRRLRLALIKVKDADTCKDKVGGLPEALDDIIYEAKLVKTALGSSLPISWYAEADDASIGEGICIERSDGFGGPNSEKIDSVSAAGFEMVELLILAGQILKDRKTRQGS